MLEMLRKIWRTGKVTKQTLMEEAPSRLRGKPILTTNECTDCGACVTNCPTDAIQFIRHEAASELAMSYADCICCGICAEVCEPETIQITNEYRLATKNKDDLLQVVQVPIKQPAELMLTGRS